MPEVNVERRKQPESTGALTSRGQGTWWPQRTAEFLSMSPFAMARRIFDEMDRTFGGMRWPELRGESGESWWPSVEVVKQNGNLVVRADLPGMNKEDVKVEVADGSLVIQGERKREQEETGKGFYRSERSYGSFSRSISLPEGAQSEQARANFNNGVLEVSIPCPESKTKGRQIPIETGQKK